jgi:hypothetical protein
MEDEIWEEKEDEEEEEDAAFDCMEKAKVNLRHTQKCQTPPLVYDIPLNTLSTHLSKYVLHQDYAMYDVAKVVCTSVDMGVESEYSDDSNKPTSLLLTGPTGLGKNLTVRVLKQLFRMNTDHSVGYIEYRFGLMNRETQFSILTGSRTICGGVSLSSQSDSLYDKLKQATSYYKSHHQEERNGVPQPHIILILFDEIDKADKRVFELLNCFLSDGCFPNELGQIYRTPKSIRLIICCTANFGTEAILSKGFNIPLEHYDDLKVLVKKEMSDKDYSHCDISRLGTIVPFFPPTKKQLYVILAHKFLEILFRRDRFIEMYGLVKYEDKDVYCFIKAFVENNEHNICSIKDIVNAFDTEISTLFSHTYDLFCRQKDNELPLREQPKLIYGSLPYSDDIHVVLKQSTLLKNAVSNLEYERRLAKRINNKCPIQFLTITHPQVKNVSITIVPLQTNVIKELYNRCSDTEKSYISKLPPNMKINVTTKHLDYVKEIDMLKERIALTGQRLNTIEHNMCIKGSLIGIHNNDDSSEISKNEESKSLDKKTVKKRKRVDSGKDNICIHCGKKFSNESGRSSLKRHLDKKRCPAIKKVKSDNTSNK